MSGSSDEGSPHVNRILLRLLDLESSDEEICREENEEYSNEAINFESQDLFSSEEEDESIIPGTQGTDEIEDSENESPDFFDTDEDESEYFIPGTQGSDNTDNLSDCIFMSHEQLGSVDNPVIISSDSDLASSELEYPDSDDSESQSLLSHIRKKMKK